MPDVSPVGSLFRHSQDGEIFRAGQRIFSQGDPGDAMFVVQEGEVDIVVGEKVVETVNAGGFLGEMALIDQSSRSASAVARTDCKLVRIDPRRFQYLVQQTPFFAIEVMRVMARRLRQMDANL